MRPGPDVWQRSQPRERETIRPETGQSQGATVPLTEEQRQVLAVLQTQRQGMTVRQLQSRLPCAAGGVQQMLEGLLERQLVARLNTIVPSYVCRYGGVDLDAD